MLSVKQATFWLLLAVCVHGQFSFGRNRNGNGSRDRHRDGNKEKDGYSSGRGYSNSGSNYNALDRDTSYGSSSGSYGSGNTYGTSSNSGSGNNYGGASGYGSGGYGGSSGYSGGGHSGYGYEKHINPLAALVAPLAGLALLGAAAAVATNPVLLTLAVLSSGRKKRETSENDDLQSDDLQNMGLQSLDPETSKKVKDLQILEKYIASVPNAKPNEKLMADYLSCSGYMEPLNQCMDRVVCEYSDQDSQLNEMERDVMSIVLYNIMGNSRIDQKFKSRLRNAAQLGKSEGRCYRFFCSQLNEE